MNFLVSISYCATFLDVASVPRNGIIKGPQTSVRNNFALSSTSRSCLKTDSGDGEPFPAKTTHAVAMLDAKGKVRITKVAALVERSPHASLWC